MSVIPKIGVFCQLASAARWVNITIEVLAAV
jgi:hypothetical protein